MPFAAIAKLGQLVTGAVEAAVPRSFGHVLTKHWFLLLYVFELLAIGIAVVLQVAGASATARPVIRFAVIALALTLGANIALWLLARRLRGRKGVRSWLWTFVKLVLFLAAAGVVVLAFLQLRHLGETTSGSRSSGPGSHVPAATRNAPSFCQEAAPWPRKRRSSSVATRGRVPSRLDIRRRCDSKVLGDVPAEG